MKSNEQYWPPSPTTSNRLKCNFLQCPSSQLKLLLMIRLFGADFEYVQHSDTELEHVENTVRKICQGQRNRISKDSTNNKTWLRICGKSEKAAWKRDRYQLDPNARALECLACAHPCSSGDLQTTSGTAPLVHIFF